MSDYRTLVVPYDFSAHARAALDTAVDLARRFGSDLHLVHVVHTPSYAYAYGTYGAAAVQPPLDMAAVRQAAERSLRELAAELGDLPGKVEPLVVEGAGLAERICDAAEQVGADLIVMGTHGRTGLAHVFLGSVAERTLRKAPCPVLSVHAPEDDDSND